MSRQKVHRSLWIDMGRGYRVSVKDVASSPLLRPDDDIREVNARLITENVRGGEAEEHQHVFLRVSRIDDETDQEYSDRVKNEERHKQEIERKERDELVRLKAKYESS